MSTKWTAAIKDVIVVGGGGGGQATTTSFKHAFAVLLREASVI